MSVADATKLKEIFHAARELPPPSRNDYLREACGEDEALRREIDALLESDHASHHFIVDPPAELAAEVFGGEVISPDAGRTLGPYKLLKCIGTGGMGAVYLAERADGRFRMQVAIKLIKRGMDSDSVLRRFEHERQILASLEHPNIARLLDGGTTDDGLPYFVMEYIQGERIDRYAEQGELSISDRLELFRQVCGAVSYAHQRLVVHRDLKPSNILITNEGIPKLLDFGIAKLIQPNEESATFATMTGAPLMTPEYASPEQIEGTPATTLSDVYSLGAVLYELLAGCPPYRLQNRSAQEVAKISTAQIEKPSAVAKRTEDARRLRGDVDNIVRMAMRRESGRRYLSVEQFSEDIRRHLTGRPVIARPDTMSYRATKFVRRNRAGVAAAFLLFLTLVAGIVATSWQARRAAAQEQRARAEQARAERRFDQVRKLANSVLFDYHDAIMLLPGATKVRERLVTDGLDYLDSLAGEAQDDPALQRELAGAYERVADVRGGVGASLGNTEGALENYQTSLRIREALFAANPKDAQSKRDVARSHQKIGFLLQNERRDGTKPLEHLRTATALYLEVTQEDPANLGFRLELADTHNRLGQMLYREGDTAGALEKYRASLALSEALAAADPHNHEVSRALFNNHRSISALLFAQEDIAGAIAANDKAVAVGERMLADAPDNREHRRAAVIGYRNGARYRAAIDKEGALQSYRKAVALDEELLATDTADKSMRSNVALTHKEIAEFLANTAEHNSEALFHFRRAVEIFEKIVAETPADALSRYQLAALRAGAAGMQARLGDVTGALHECDEAIALLDQTATSLPEQPRRAEAYEYLGYAYAALAKSDKISVSDSPQRMSTARDMFRQALSILDEVRTRKGLGPDERWAQGIAAEIAKCDAELAR